MDTEYTKMSAYIKDLNDRMTHQMQLEAGKGVNRMIAIIRIYGREYDEKYKDDPTVIQGGFIKYIKKHLLKLNPPEDFKAAINYL